MPDTILVVEDEESWANLVRDILEKRGYHVTVACGADKAFAQIKALVPDLIILDVQLAGISGMQLCEWLRSDPSVASVPILMLTAFKSERDKVMGLSVGADDYLTKPFGHEELSARVMALLRRVKARSAVSQLAAGPLVVDLERHEVLAKGKPLELRPKEFDLLALLIRHKGKLLRRGFIAESVWGKDAIATSQTIAQHVKNLRAKLGPYGKLIETVETLGYRFLDK